MGAAMRPLITLLALLMFTAAPAWAQEAVSGDQAAQDAAAVAASLRVDSLGRPFPDPELLALARRWKGGGIGLTIGGGAAVVSGLFLGSALARGEISSNTGAIVTVSAVFGLGLVSAGVGVPLASAGGFTEGQLNRTIKGAEKVPRTVANERAYWEAYLQRQYGQAASIIGGGAVLLTVVEVAAVVATIGTDFYKPPMWLAPVGTAVAGAATIALGVHLQRDADATMKSLREGGTARRRVLRPHLPAVALSWDGEAGGAGVQLRWGFDF